MRFRCLAVTAVLCFVPAVVFAQDCPEGDWFCDSPQQDEQSSDDGAAEEPAAESSGSANDKSKEKTGPPLVVYTPKGSPKPSKVIVVETPPPKPARRRKLREWGFNLHLDVALMGDDAAKANNAEMGGLGFAFRYRPVPVLAVDAGLELVGGRDWNGYDRRENAFLADLRLYLNPRATFQLYWFGGFGLSGATVQIENDQESFQEHYSYFGLQTGLGVEARISKKVAIEGDLLGFVRGRSDAKDNARPEFVDPETHRATNASGGGLIRGGVTFYW